ncbi:MAG: branched-chain amino acid ABC transporter substrate-binding protein, partial [Hylemonella sp.]|nr:branched-chain amino acid ABC transporter substrate-binding protein [Hylemonella sp.]
SARPVVGDAGWVALAWHGSFERFGAPQLVRRFIKSVKRPMTNHDWAAWIAGKTVAAAAASGAPTPAALSRALLDLQFDGSKGVALSFRPWDGQLRQPLLLTDGQGVLTTLPVDGVLHPSNALDTLGADAPQRLCKARS